MDMISLQGKTNFFEKRVSEYQKAGVLTKMKRTENSALTQIFNIQLKRISYFQ